MLYEKYNLLLEVSHKFIFEKTALFIRIIIDSYVFKEPLTILCNHLEPIIKQTL